MLRCSISSLRGTRIDASLERIDGRRPLCRRSCSGGNLNRGVRRLGLRPRCLGSRGVVGASSAGSLVLADLDGPTPVAQEAAGRFIGSPESQTAAPASAPGPVTREIRARNQARFIPTSPRALGVTAAFGKRGKGMRAALTTSTSMRSVQPWCRHCMQQKRRLLLASPRREPILVDPSVAQRRQPADSAGSPLDFYWRKHPPAHLDSPRPRLIRCADRLLRARRCSDAMCWTRSRLRTVHVDPLRQGSLPPVLNPLLCAELLQPARSQAVPLRPQRRHQHQPLF